MGSGVSVMRGRRGVQGFVRSERARGITEGGVRDNGSLRAPLRAQLVQWDLGTHISHNGTEREGGSGTAGGRRGSHEFSDRQAAPPEKEGTAEKLSSHLCV